MGHSDQVLLVCLVLIEMHISIKYNASMINHVGRRGSYRRNVKWLPLKKYMSYWPNIVIEFTKGLHQYLCKIQSFCHLACDQEECAQMMTTMTA